jgi:carbonic anhydrase
VNRLRKKFDSRPGPGAAVLVAAALFFARAVSPGVRAEDGRIDWSYSGDKGPEHWAELAPDFGICARGQFQSPIDIRGANPLPYVPLAFHYSSQALEAVNDGRGVYLLSKPGSELRIRGEPYALAEIHFHVPGEHRVEGAGAAAEIQLVHRDGEGRQIVVVVPVRPGDRGNTTLARIVERLPLLPGERVFYRQVGINPLFVLPTDRSYFSYTGSLATPPCSEPVAWILLAQSVELRPDLMGRLARATGQNARPIQPLNGRPVYAFPQHP